jgi:hypothetical protein
MKAKATRWALVVIMLSGCGDDGAAVPDSAAGKDSTPKTEARTTDLPTGSDQGPVPDGPKLVDGAKPDAGPIPDMNKLDGAKPDAAKGDAKKPDGAGTKCTPNPCQHGGTCTPTSAGFTCTCTAGWKGTTCQTASYCDVVYRVTGSFHSTDVPLVGQFTKPVGTNAALPAFNPARTTPFTPAAFGAGFFRLRFPNLAGAPAAGAVQIVEAYMPMEFTVNSLGTVVNSDVDQSAGLLALSGNPQQIGDPPVLSRACAAVASGTLAGTSLTWGACSAIPDNTTSWTFAKAQSGDPGCLHRMSVWGNVTCTSGFCNLVPGTGNQHQTWDQKLNTFTFSGTNYATATFTMAEVQAPNLTSVKTFLAITATSVLKVECDTAAPLSCDEK